MHALKEMLTVFCDIASFHEVRIIAPFDQINEDSRTRDICIALVKSFSDQK